MGRLSDATGGGTRGKASSSLSKSAYASGGTVGIRGKASSSISKAIRNTGGGSSSSGTYSSRPTKITRKDSGGKVIEVTKRDSDKEVITDTDGGQTRTFKETRPSASIQIREGGTTRVLSEKAFQRKQINEQRTELQGILFTKQEAVARAKQPISKRVAAASTQRSAQYIEEKNVFGVSVPKMFPTQSKQVNSSNSFIEPAPERSNFERSRVALRRKTDQLKQEGASPYAIIGLETLAFIGDINEGIKNQANRVRNYEGSATVEFLKQVQRPKEVVESAKGLIPTRAVVFAAGFGVGQSLRLNTERVAAEIIVLEAAGFGAIKVGQRISPTGRALSRFDKLKKGKGVGGQTTSFDLIEQEIRTPTKATSPSGTQEILKTNQISTIERFIPREPTVTTAEITGGKASQRVIQVGGKQYSTAETIIGGERFFLRTTSGKGQTVSKLFRGDKQIKTFISESSPKIAFTEPVLSKTSPRTTIVQGKGLTIEAEGYVLTSKSIPLKGQPKIEVKISSVIERQVTAKEPFIVSISSPKTVETFREVGTPKFIFGDEGKLQPSRFILSETGEATSIKQATTTLEEVTRRRTTFTIEPQPKKPMEFDLGDFSIGFKKNRGGGNLKDLFSSKKGQVSILPENFIQTEFSISRSKPVKGATGVLDLFETGLNLERGVARFPKVSLRQESLLDINTKNKEQQVQRPIAAGKVITSNELDFNIDVVQVQRPIAATNQGVGQLQAFNQKTIQDTDFTPVGFIPSSFIGRGKEPDVPPPDVPPPDEPFFGFGLSPFGVGFSSGKEPKQRKVKVKERILPTVETVALGLKPVKNLPKKLARTGLFRI